MKLFNLLYSTHIRKDDRKNFVFFFHVKKKQFSFKSITFYGNQNRN